MARLRGGQSAQWPTAGERQCRCTLQSSTPTDDEGGGRTEPSWTTFGTWWAKVTTIPVVPNETDAMLSVQVEGPYRADLVDTFNAGLGVRVIANGDTFKVSLLDNPQMRNRTLVAHCAKAVRTA